MRPASGSPRKFTTSLRPPSPDKCLRQRKRSNSDSLPPRLPLKEDGIQLGSVMAQEAAKSFWNPDMLYKSLQKLTEYAAQTKMMQDSKKDSDNENLDTISSEELLDSNVEEIYTLEEDTSDDLLELSDTSITGTKGRKSCDLSSSLKLHSVLTSLHSLSDHQLQQKTHANRHVFYPLSPMRRAYTDPCLSPRIMRRRKTPVISATLQVCH